MSSPDFISAVLMWFAAVIYTEALTEIIVDSKIMFKLRDWFHKKSDFLGDLIECGYCTSVWVSITIAWALPGAICGAIATSSAVVAVFFFLVDLSVKVLVLHRMSNWLHEYLKRWMDRVPWHFVISKPDSANEDDEEKD